MAEGQTDQEIEAIRSAYAAIKGLDRGQWTRALEYLATRMAEDDRGSHVAFRIAEDFYPPTQYVLAGELSDPVATPEEAVDQAPYGLQIVEVNGIATVSQRFAVRDPCYGDATVGWFDTRDAAEVCLKLLKP